MKKFHIKDVDVKLLQIFAAVYESGSVTAAASRLDLSQSLISHALDRLRSAFDDPLFVRSGRSIAPTKRAQEMAPSITEIIDQLLALAEPKALDIREMTTEFTLSANDFERRLIGPKVLHEMFDLAPNASLCLANTDAPIADMLRTRQWDVVVTPTQAPDVHDFHSEFLFQDTFACFFDSSQLSAKQVRSDYLSLDHAVVRFAADRTSLVDRELAGSDVSRKIRLVAPSFGSLPELMKGTNLVTTLPSMLANSLFRDFERVDFPFVSPILRFNMIWHRTTQNSEEHRWFRSLIRKPYR